MCTWDYSLLLELFKALWSWVTLAGIAIYVWRHELKLLVTRIATSKKVSGGGITIEMDPHQAPSAPPIAAPQSTSPEVEPVQEFTEEVVGRHITGEVHIDGKKYTNCVFENGTLIFSGKAPLSFVGCTFGQGLAWKFAGNAALTLGFMKAMYHGGAASMIEMTFDSLVRKP